ncbi:MAG TPA: thrombospondin type 3 repeat-containing protein [Kofleriaceae bacterium]|nr:thrombospondin type 3 repeat-containing protein [Kofleriaceae bacterium]
MAHGKLCGLFGIATLALAARAEAAVTFPGDASYIPLACEGTRMTDLYADEAGALMERDIVGDLGAPAGFRASDATNLYLRLRLDQDPAPGGAVRPFSWGFEIDLDGNLTDYELLILVSGIGGAGMVSVFTNNTVTLPNDPNDPADQPAVMAFAFADNGRSTIAGDSSFGGDDDFFLDFAIPWSVLAPLGLDHDTPIFVWAASSSTDNSLNGDFACHDGATGDPLLDAIASDGTVGDPTLDTDGDGFTDAEEVSAGSDPLDPNSIPTVRLEGGGGCTTSGGDSLAGALLGIVALARCRRRRTARSR